MCINEGQSFIPFFLYFVFYTEKVYISCYHVLMIMLYSAYKLPQTLCGILL